MKALSRKSFRYYAQFCNSTVCRSLLTGPLLEPPPTVPERPCTVVLAEDGGFHQSSWHDAFSIRFPQDFGMSYTRFSFQKLQFDEALEEMKSDLSQPGTILVARGPLVSWMAQFYLESVPLAGLVMVDPLDLDDQNAINQFELAYTKRELKASLEYGLFQEYALNWAHWTLQLEPGAVPMIVLNTVNRPAFKRAAENTARRHGDSVVVEKCDEIGTQHAETAAELIAKWIEDSVL